MAPNGRTRAGPAVALHRLMLGPFRKLLWECPDLFLTFLTIFDSECTIRDRSL